MSTLIGLKPASEARLRCAANVPRWINKRRSDSRPFASGQRRCHLWIDDEGFGVHDDNCLYNKFFLQKVHIIMIIRAVLISLCLTTTVQAQKLVDPSKVAPEFREAAVKRRAEQMKELACAKKAEDQKVVLRERAAFVNSCLETADEK
jgi:hypothetical protein